MPLAAQADVETRLGRELSEDEIARLDGLLAEASALVEGYLGTQYSGGDDIPPAVVIVVSKIVARALSQSSELEGMAAAMESANSGPFGARFRESSVFLTKAEKLMLRPFGGGFRSVPLRSDRGYSVDYDEDGS